MMRFLFIFFITIPFLGMSQEITPLFPGVGFSLEPETELLQMQEFEDCYCEAIYKKGTDTIIGLKALTYPLPVQKSNKWGAINKQGVEVLPFIYSYPTLLTEDGMVSIAKISSENYQWKSQLGATLTLLDSTGNPKEKYHVSDFYKGAFLATKDSLSWGLINSKMNVLVDFEYIGSHHKGEEFFFSKNGYVTMRQNKPGGLNGIVNYKGKTVIPFKWKLLSYVVTDENHIYAMNDYLKRGYINLKGQTTLSFLYDKVPRIITDSNQVSTEKYTYFLDKDFKQIGPKYQAYERKGKLWFFKQNGKWGIKDINNETIIPNIYTTIMDGPRIKDKKDFKCYIVVKNGLYGLINLDGSIIIKPAYECLCGLGYYAPTAYYIEFKKSEVSYKFSETGALIEKGGKSGGGCFCE
jgi:WG containing repeat